MLSGHHPCYYQVFEDQSAPDWRPLARCPACDAPLVARSFGEIHYRVCDECGLCSMVGWDES